MKAIMKTTFCSVFLVFFSFNTHAQSDGRRHSDSAKKVSATNDNPKPKPPANCGDGTVEKPVIHDKGQTNGNVVGNPKQ
jgi:hypothetical protein